MPKSGLTKPGRTATHRLAVVLGWCAFVTFAVVAVDYFGPPQLSAPLDDAENYVRDSFARTGRFTPANTNLVLIGIDRPSYEDVFITDEDKNDPVRAALLGRFPAWPRLVWAALITRLADAGAKTIAIDIVFAARTENDKELAGALDKYQDRVVIGANYAVAETDRGNPAQITPPNSSLIPDTSDQPAALDSRVGFVNIWPDDDDVFRRARFRATNHELGDVVNAAPSAVVSSFDARVLEKAGAAETIPGDRSRARIRFTGPPGTWPAISIADVLTPKIWERNFAGGKFFAGKIVVIGPTANIFQDFHRTPFRQEMAGPEIHLNIINAALHGEYLRGLPGLGTASLIALAGLVGAMLCQLILAPVGGVPPL